MASPTAENVPTLASSTPRSLIATLSEAASAYLKAKTDEAKTQAMANLNDTADRVMSAREGMLIIARRSMRDSMYEEVVLWQRRDRYRPEVVAVMTRVHNYFKV